ncbi:AAA family ATPase [Deinococcus altitudinis]|uniref:AAA family ATPase n=1 Tax=Deinococcus altitudinis TaxID=468914 RepID=UPI003891A792
MSLDPPALETALETLPGRLRGLAARRPGFSAALTGEAGIGKSFMLRALLSGLSCASFTVFAGQDPAALLRALPRPRRVSRPTEATLDRLEEGADLPYDALIAAFTALLPALAPVVLCLEDLHDADPARLAFWSQIAEVTPQMRGVALLASSRTEPPSGFEVLRPERLDLRRVQTMLEAEVHAELPPAALDWIFERSAGNPLYTLEYFRLLARQGLLWSDGRAWRWRRPPDDLMPLSVEALIERKLRDAAPEGPVRTVLAALALCPPGHAARLEVISGLEPTDTRNACRRLTAQGVLTSGTTPDFAHPLYREVTLRTLPAADRRLLARRAIAVLGRDRPEDAAALVEAADLEPGVALTLLTTAADAAEAEVQQARAGRLLARALDYWPLNDGQRERLEERGRLALRASRLLESSAVAEARALAQQAVEALPHDLDATLHLAQLRVYQSRTFDDGEALLAHLPPEVRSGPQAQRARIAWSAQCGEFLKTLDLWRSLPEAEHTAETSYYGGGALTFTGEPVRGEAVLRSALETLNSKHVLPKVHAGLLNFLSVTQSRLGQHPQAEQTMRQAIALCDHHGMDLQLATALQNFALNLEFSGQHREMRRTIEQAVAAYTRAGEPRRALAAQQMLATRALEDGQFEEAETLLLECRDGLRGAGASAHLLATEALLLSVYLSWDHPPARVLAEKLAVSILAQARSLGPQIQAGVHAYIHAMRTEIRWGSLAHARALAQEVEERYPHKPLPFGMMMQGALAALSEAEHRYEDARAHCSAAVDLAEGLNLKVDAQLYRLELDRLREDQDAAGQRLEWFEARGCGLGVVLARRYFPLLDVRPPESLATSLELGVLGPLTLNGAALRGQRRTELLLALVEARLLGKSGVRTLDLVEALYPQVGEETAVSALKQTVFKFRSQYGAQSILTTAQGYALGAVQSDAEQFLRGGDSGRWDLGLWRGDYGGGDRPVPEPLTLALKRAVRDALASDPFESARAAELLLGHDPFDLAALHLRCLALEASDQPQLLERIYGEARLRLAELGEPLPSKWRTFLNNGADSLA